MFCEYCSSCVKCGDVVSVSVTTCKFNVNSTLQKISREPSSSGISTEASLDNDSNKEVLNVNNVLPAIIEQKCDINFIQTLSGKSNRRCYEKS